jgi:hypothetical protein
MMEIVLTIVSLLVLAALGLGTTVLLIFLATGKKADGTRNES